MHELTLSATADGHPQRWTWHLRAADGSEVASATVDLRTADARMRTAFRDLQRFANVRADVTDRAGDIRWWLKEVGDWIGRDVLGEVGEALHTRAPAVVRVVAGNGLAHLTERPLELARVDGRSLASSGVVFIHEVDLGAADMAAPAPESLRILGIFSGGTTAPVDVGAEWEAIDALVDDLRARGVAIEFTALRHGASRGRIRALLDEDPDWDIVHIAGHHGTQGVQLDGHDGLGEVVPVDELHALLERCAGRLRLVVMSNCRSAGAVAADLRRHLDIEVDDATATAFASDGATPLNVTGAVGRSRRWGTLAMRFEMDDAFLVPLIERFYTALLRGTGTPASALSTALVDQAAHRTADVAVGAPVLIGGTTTRWCPTLPHGGRPRQRADLPPRAPFVGRIATLARISTVVAAEAPTPVLLTGMAGVGKSACAIECADAAQDQYETVVWHQIVKNPADTRLGPDRLASRLASALGVTEFGAGGWAATCTKVAATLAVRRVLVVLDGLEAATDGAVGWNDDRWEPLVRAVVTHGGRSAAIVTSRMSLPDELSFHHEPITTLTSTETVLLLARLPGFHVALNEARRSPRTAALLRRVLAIVQGHPKLLELAYAALTTSGRGDDAIEQRLARAERLWRDQPPSARVSDADTYMAVLRGWTEDAVAALDSDARLVLVLLALLEEEDRTASHLRALVTDLHEGTDHDRTAADTEIRTLERSALIAVGGDGDTRVHPVVVDVARALPAGVELRQLVDRLMAARLTLPLLDLFDPPADAAPPENPTQAITAPVPYLVRAGEWGDIMTIAQRSIHVDRSPAVVATMMTAVRTVVEHCPDGDMRRAALGIAALLTRATDPHASRPLFEEVHARAEREGDVATAAAAAHALADLHRAIGSFRTAIGWQQRCAELHALAGMGPWEQLNERLFAVAVRAPISDPKEVLARCAEFETELAALPPPDPEVEGVDENVVRGTLDTVGAAAAMDAGAHDVAVHYVARCVDRMEREGASETEVARIRINAAVVESRRGNTDAAERIALTCKEVFQEAEHHAELVTVFQTLTEVETDRGNPALAWRYAQHALRYAYLNADVVKVLGAHQYSAQAAWHLGRDVDVVTHGIAASLLAVLTSQHVRETVEPLYWHLADRPTPRILQSFDALCTALGEHGPKLSRVVEPLIGHDGDGALAVLRAWLAAVPDFGPVRQVLDDLIAATGSGEGAGGTVPEAQVQQLARHPRWSRLADRLHRLMLGERDLEVLTASLDPVEANLLVVALGLVSPDHPDLQRLLSEAPRRPSAS